ncbi:protein of unknown function DUF29 [Candidatus Magnetoovum chiemensis]|nr:protein of unknown function DUF29 [Candidatus Magnetoovum chiemensis]
MYNAIQEPVEQAEAIKEKSLYETDFYQWALKTADLLRQGRFTELDIKNIAEEIEDLGKNNKRELASRLAVLIMHLLKWQYQPEKRSDSWITTINIQRIDIELVLEDSPSLKYDIDKVIEKAFIIAKRKFKKETGLDKNPLPKACPYTWEQLNDDDFLPE